MMPEIHTLNSFLENYNVKIPQIQRDYAQGRLDKTACRIRNNFLEALFKAVTEEPMDMDFVYGEEEDGSIILLDGQQRITTLYLLYWYAYAKDNRRPELEMALGEEQEAFPFSSEDIFERPNRNFPFDKFSYETRYSSRYFMERLTAYVPELPAEKISSQIINQSWFSLSWENDPTISSMLVMIDAINNKFASIDDLWQRLEKGAITFHFLKLKDMGLSDELYVRMNSRGRPLTRFEHFKADLEKRLTTVDTALAKQIAHRFDVEWTEFLWRNRPDLIERLSADEKKSYTEVIDIAFMNIFAFICDVICYKRGQSNNGRSYDEFAMLDRFFTVSDMTNAEEVEENAKTLESIFDSWNSIPLKLSEYAQSFFSSGGHEEGKVRGRSGLFSDWLNEYLNRDGETRKFTFGNLVVLYAFTVYLQQADNVGEADFRRRLRIVINLVDNSEDQLSDSEVRAGGNHMPAILRQVESIITKGEFIHEGNDFNTIQIEEEIAKLDWTAHNPDLAESLYRLEDHELLHGQIGIVGLEYAGLFNRFESLFSCNWDKVDCALMATGDYHQREKNGWRCQFGSAGNRSAWEYLFHKRDERAEYSREGFENTKDILITLLKKHEIFNDVVLDGIKADYIAECESLNRFTFRYYYMSYDSFRPGKYGKCWMDEGDSFNIVMLLTKSNVSPSSYQPFLKAMSPSFSTEEDVSILNVDGSSFTCEKDGLKFNGTRLDCVNTEDGIDDVDRIKAGQAWLASKTSQT